MPCAVLDLVLARAAREQNEQALNVRTLFLNTSFANTGDPETAATTHDDVLWAVRAARGRTGNLIALRTPGHIDSKSSDNKLNN